MADDQGKPKLHIDSDWKAEAQREKERLAQKEKARAPKPGPAAAAADPGAADRDQHELPEANFRSLVGLLASQAIMGLGAMADPQTGRVVVDLEGARFAIDLLDVLDQKTKGNLVDDEGKDLRQVLSELRSRYVQISQFVARQLAAQQTAELKGTAGLGGIPGVPGGVGAAAGGPLPPLRTQ